MPSDIEDAFAEIVKTCGERDRFKRENRSLQESIVEYQRIIEGLESRIDQLEELVT